MTEQLDKDNLFRTPIRLKGPSAGQMLMKTIDKESGKAGGIGFGHPLTHSWQDCAPVGYRGVTHEYCELCCMTRKKLVNSAAVSEAILSNSQSAPKYSLKTQLWIGAWIFLSIASGVALGFMKGCR